MAKFSVVWCLAVVVVAACSANAQSSALPQLDQEEWWGLQESEMDSVELQRKKTIRPFNVKVEPSMVKYLRRRLQNYRWVPPLEGTAFEYGFNSNQMNFWANYWANEYNFTNAELVLNQFPQYKVYIQGLDIHFIRVTPEVPDGVTCMPLLLLHGWGGSVREYFESIPILTTPRDGIVFEVIVPSLPGYGFSEGAVRPGMGPAQIAVILKNLMKKIGYSKFYVAGGDWGSVIGRALATLYQDDILGFHSTALTVLNSCAEIRNLLGGYIATLQVELHQYNRTALTNIAEETGYIHLQATKPDTVGVSLADSPTGTMAYIFEKYSTWTHPDNRLLPDGGLFNHFTPDQLLDNILIYWMTNSMTTSMRLYAEYFSKAHRALGIDEYPTTVPVWNIQAPFDLFPQPLNKMKFLNVLGVTVLDDGGHFLALQLPDVYSADVFKAMKAFKDYHDANNQN